MHRGAFCQFPFRWIYYCHSSKSTGKEIGKTRLCAIGRNQAIPKRLSIFYFHILESETLEIHGLLFLSLKSRPCENSLEDFCISALFACLRVNEVDCYGFQNFQMVSTLVIELSLFLSEYSSLNFSYFFCEITPSRIYHCLQLDHFEFFSSRNLLTWQLDEM